MKRSIIKRLTIHKNLYTEVPDTLRCHLILTGYRPVSSLTASIKSIFSLHNETLNIWTHLLAVIYFCYKFILGMYDSEPNYPIRVALFTGILMYLFSAVGHTLCCLTPPYHHVGFLVDYMGVSVFSYGIVAAYGALIFPKEHLSLSQYWPVEPQYLYVALGMFMSILALLLSASTRITRSNKYKSALRAITFGIPYFYSLILLIYCIRSCHYSQVMPKNFCDLKSSFQVHFFTLCAAIFFYISHIPEYFISHYFDLFGHSHQLFHIFASSSTYFIIQSLEEFTKSKAWPEGYNLSSTFMISCLLIVIVFDLLIAYFIFVKIKHRVLKEMKE